MLFLHFTDNEQFAIRDNACPRDSRAQGAVLFGTDRPCYWGFYCEKRPYVAVIEIDQEYVEYSEILEAEVLLDATACRRATVKAVLANCFYSNDDTQVYECDCNHDEACIYCDSWRIMDYVGMILTLCQIAQA